MAFPAHGARPRPEILAYAPTAEPSLHPTYGVRELAPAFDGEERGKKLPHATLDERDHPTCPDLTREVSVDGALAVVSDPLEGEILEAVFRPVAVVKVPPFVTDDREPLGLHRAP